MLKPHHALLLLLVLLLRLDVSLGNIQDVVAACTESRRCGCAVGVTEGEPCLVRVWNKEIRKECVGVLINDFYVLANAECRNTTNLPDEELLVTHHERRLVVDRAILPPNYIPDKIPRCNDIMLLRLREVVNMTTHVPICLPAASMFVPLYTKAFIMAPGKRSVGVRIQDRTCYFRRRVRDVARSILLRDDLFLCVGDISTPFCNDKPGNLLVLKEHGWYTLLGLSTTHELFPMCSNSMGLFSEVLPLREWIRNNTQDATQCQFV